MKKILKGSEIQKYVPGILKDERNKEILKYLERNKYEY